MVGDDAFADKVGEHPVGVGHGRVSERFLNAIVRKRGDARFALLEILHDGVERGASLELRELQRIEQVVLAGQAAKHHVGQRHAVRRVQVAERGAFRVGAQRQAVDERFHVHFDEAHAKLVPHEGNLVDRNGDVDLLVMAMQVLDRDHGTRYALVVEAVLVDVVLGAKRRVDKPVLVDECELLERVELLHLGLERLQVGHVGQIVGREQADGAAHVGELVFEVGLDDLLAASRKLVEVEHADRPNGVLGCTVDVLAHPP